MKLKFMGLLSKIAYLKNHNNKYVSLEIKRVSLQEKLYYVLMNWPLF